jgi:hypothetical protein
VRHRKGRIPNGGGIGQVDMRCRGLLTSARLEINWNRWTGLAFALLGTQFTAIGYPMLDY